MLEFSQNYFSVSEVVLKQTQNILLLFDCEDKQPKLQKVVSK